MMMMRMMVSRGDLQLNMVSESDGDLVFFTFPKFYL
jgi:hypothetical protein